MHKHTHSQAFSLVELLVVVAIIGILASVTMGSLSTVRSNARDKSIQASMQSVLIEASLFKAKNSGGYVDTATFCGDAEIVKYVGDNKKIDTDNGSTYEEPACIVTGAGANNKFYVRAQLNSGAYYCVDSTKFFGNDTGAPVSGLCKQ